MSIIPVAVLYYLYMQVRDYGGIRITEETFFMTLCWVVLGVGVGYFAMRLLINDIIKITQTKKETLKDIIGSKAMQDISASNSNEIAILAQSFNEITSRLEDNVRSLELAKKTLHSVLAKVGEGIASMDNIDTFLHLILETVTEALQCKAGVLLLLSDKGDDLKIQAVHGMKLDGHRAIRLTSDKEFSDLVTTKKVAVLEKKPRNNFLNLMDSPILVSPLVLHDKVSGALCLSNRNSVEPFNDEEKNLIHNLALQTAVAIENSRLNEDAEKTYFETISALALAVEAKDPYSRGHLDRVSRYVMMIAKELNLSQEQMKILRDGARLHDIGKIGVTDKILTKAGPLTPEEMDVMRKHCEIGEGIIKPIRSLRNLCDMVRHHHEKLDGSGYPDALKGDQVNFLVRILSIADIYDALTSNRSYRQAFTPERAKEELRAMKDKVDQKVVEAFVRASQKEPVV
jgi:HD-GYP domain-containing protein (c-di-GMP phosphodiesterase class II)